MKIKLKNQNNSSATIFTLNSKVYRNIDGDQDDFSYKNDDEKIEIFCNSLKDFILNSWEVDT